MRRLVEVVFVTIAASVGLVAGVSKLMADNAPAEAQMSAAQKCRMDLAKEDFPDQIVEKALTSKGVPQNQIKEIVGKLQSEAKNIPETYKKEYVHNEQEEPAATNDPLSEIYMTENMDDVREEVFLKVMKQYVSDADVAVDMFKDIVAQRNAAIKACGHL